MVLGESAPPVYQVVLTYRLCCERDLNCNDKSVTIVLTGGVVLWKRRRH